MKHGMLKKTLCIMMAMAVCLTSISLTSLTALADDADDSACTAAADGKHVPDWDRKEVKKEVTCTEDGEYWLICTLCNQQYLEVIPATGHQEVKDKKVEATCEKTGLTEGSHCSVCGEILKKQEKIPATGHQKVKDKKVEATCKKTGLTEGSHCSVCGKVLKEQKEVPKTEHNWNKSRMVKESSCENTGIKEYTCKDCGKTKEETLPAKGHQAVTDQQTAATCTENGLTEGRHCSVCGKVINGQEVIPATGHMLSIVVAHQEGTCMTPERWTHQCLKDGTLWEEEGTYGSHNWTMLKGVEASCTETGLTEGTGCSVCGMVQRAQEVIPATGHAYHFLLTRDEETGTIRGEQVCIHCNEVKKESTIENLYVRSIEDENCMFYDENGEKLKELSDNIQFYTSTSDDGAQNVVYTDDNADSNLREFSVETGDEIHNLTVNVGESGTIQMQSPDGIDQMGISMSLDTKERAILFFNENHSITSIKNIKLDGNSVTFESENGNELTISSENVKYEIGDIDDSDDNYIVAEQVEGDENTVQFSMQSAEAVHEEQTKNETEDSKTTEESDTDEAAERTETYEPVQIVFGTVTLEEEKTEDEETIVQFKNQEEDEKIEKYQEESPPIVIVKFVDTEEEEKNSTEETKIKNVTFNFSHLAYGCDCDNKKCSVCNLKSGKYAHSCKHKNCFRKEYHYYENGKCMDCNYKHKKHIWVYCDEESDKCVICGATNKHKWKNNKDGSCKCEKCSHKEEHNYKNGKCMRCGYKHENHEYQYISLSGKDKCICGKEVSHKWNNNKDGTCICKNCGHQEAHSYKNGKCTRCGYKHENHEYQYISLSGNDKCICGKEVSHKWNNNKDGTCICKNCGHQEAHSYKNGKCTHCSYKHGNKEHNYVNKVCTVCGKKK